MKTCAAAISLALLSSLLPLSRALAVDSSSISTEGLQRAYDIQCKALLSGDFNAWEKTMSTAYTLTTADAKRLSREELIGNTRKSLVRLRWTECSATIREVWRSGTTLKVLVTNLGRAVTTDTPPETIETGADSIDSWITVNDGLLQIASVDIDSTLTVAGKVISLSRLPTSDSGDYRL